VAYDRCYGLHKSCSDNDAFQPNESQPTAAPKSPLKKQYKAMLRQKEFKLVDALEENYELLEERGK
jgi:hypothetical protein